MGLNKIFSAQGRIPRSGWWKAILLALFWPLPLVAVIIPLAAAGNFKNLGWAGENIFYMFFIIMIGVSTSITVFANIKRLHDLNKSGRLALLHIVPLANLWLFLTCAFVKGDSSDNKYGPALK